MHYQGKRHQKISEIHARKQSKREQQFLEKMDKENSVKPDSNELKRSSILPQKTIGDARCNGLFHRTEASGSNNGSITESSTASNTDKAYKHQNIYSSQNHPLQTHTQPITKITTPIHNLQQYNQLKPHVSSKSDTASVKSDSVQSSNMDLDEKSSSVNFHEPPDPLPYYIKPFEKVLKKDHLYCPVCDVHVNSEAQMKQHRSSLRHMNLEKGLPVPPRVKDLEMEKKIQALKEKASLDGSLENQDSAEPNDDKSSTGENCDIKIELPKPMQYKCEVCNCVLNSTIQLHQHLASSRHKAILEGKPPKPRWMPYHKYRKFDHDSYETNDHE